MEDKSDLLETATVAVTLPQGRRAGEERLAPATLSFSGGFRVFFGFVFLGDGGGRGLRLFSLRCDCIVCASSPPQGQLHKLSVVCASC